MSAVPVAARELWLARPQRILVGTLLVLAAVAWWQAARLMDGMASSGLDLGGFGFYVGLWVTMMAAMMFPSIAPMVLVYDRLRVARREREPHAPGASATGLFVAGYLLTWTAAGLLAYALVELGRSIDSGALAWDEAGREVVGGVVLLGALYQLTPLKAVCLRHCRSPFSFVLEHWRGGHAGALRMGVVHGAWCVGCCWALMATLFAVGIMSLGWMAFVAALIGAEKLLPRRVSGLVALVLLALGIGILAAPDDVPGLHDGPAMQMMQPEMEM